MTLSNGVHVQPTAIRGDSIMEFLGMATSVATIPEARSAVREYGWRGNQSTTGRTRQEE